MAKHLPPTGSSGTSFFSKLAKALYRISIRFRAQSIFLEAQGLFTEKEQVLNNAFGFAAHNRVTGDYLEFGVYEGNSFISAYHLSRAHGYKDMRFFAFDSFAGLPKPEGSDEAAARFTEGQFACGEPTFRKIVERSGVPRGSFAVVPGFYKDTLTSETKVRMSLGNAAVIMIDCDLYTSTVTVLNFITDLVVPGTVIIFDDWLAFQGDPNCGEQRAFREWCVSHPEIEAVPYRSYGWEGASFLVTKTGR